MALVRLENHHTKVPVLVLDKKLDHFVQTIFFLINFNDLAYYLLKMPPPRSWLPKNQNCPLSNQTNGYYCAVL